MTRETLPRFDLYGELEVSPFASVGTIEAAFRTLVKQHHPDVASGDESRMTRLNQAREWLTDPELRRRYDQETDRGRHIRDPRRPVETHSVVTRSYAERRAGPERQPSDGPPTSAAAAAAHDAEPTFGIHAGEVRQFLAELRSLDRARAQRVWNGRAVAHTKGYTQALRASASAARGARSAEWQFAREAAGVIARGKLGDSTLADQVADVLSDVAGAIAIRDLLSPGEFSLVLLPWTWRGTVRLPEMPGAAAGSSPVPPVIAPVPPVIAPVPPRVQPTVEAKPPPPIAVIPPPPVWPLARPAVAANLPPPIAAMPSAPIAPKPVPPIAPKPVPPIAVKPATPFVAAAPPARQPPSWPTQPTEPRALPPIDTRITERLAAALAATPVRSGAADAPGTVRHLVRHGPTSVRAAVFAPPRRPIGPLPVALTTASLVIFLAAALLGFPATKREQAVAAATDAPTGSVPGVALGSEPPSSIDPTDGQVPSDQPAPSTAPTTSGGGGPGPTVPPGPGSTPRPTRGPGATPKPTKPGGTPTPAPTPTPTPTPTVPPTDTPGPDCTVITLINHWTFNAQHQWATAGFTGTVIFNPAPPPDYHIKWQSLAIGALVPCTSDITVSDTAP